MAESQRRWVKSTIYWCRWIIWGRHNSLTLFLSLSCTCRPSWRKTTPLATGWWCRQKTTRSPSYNSQVLMTKPEVCLVLVPPLGGATALAPLLSPFIYVDEHLALSHSLSFFKKMMYFSRTLIMDSQNRSVNSLVDFQDAWHGHERKLCPTWWQWKWWTCPSQEHRRSWRESLARKLVNALIATLHLCMGCMMCNVIHVFISVTAVSMHSSAKYARWTWNFICWWVWWSFLLQCWITLSSIFVVAAFGFSHSR